MPIAKPTTTRITPVIPIAIFTPSSTVASDGVAGTGELVGVDDRTMIARGRRTRGTMHEKCVDGTLFVSSQFDVTTVPCEMMESLKMHFTKVIRLFV
jgi:hypothetical protein